MNIEHNFSIQCKKCGYNLSDVYVFTENIEIRRVGVCQKCGATTFELAEKTQLYKDLFTPTTPTVTCPYCNSTNCKKISTASKIGKVAMWGVLAAGSVGHTWHCNSCGSNFG